MDESGRPDQPLGHAAVLGHGVEAETLAGVSRHPAHLGRGEEGVSVGVY